jgi:SAM-dependent methyltransferase
MAALPFPDGTFDLVWCEGAAYSVGFGTALASFSRVLKPSGLAVVSEAAWFVPDPPPEARALWDRDYPAIADEATLRRRCEEAGFSVLDARRLPGSCWNDYYVPYVEAIPRQRSLWAGDPEALALLDGLQEEAETYRSFGHSYGYVLLTLRKEPTP